MRFIVMFVTAVCVLFLIKLRSPKKNNFLRPFLLFALRIFSAHPLWRHLARSRARAHCDMADLPSLILSSHSWKMAIAHQRAGAPQLFSSHQLILNFAWEKTNLISIAENWINEENNRYIVFSICCLINMWRNLVQSLIIQLSVHFKLKMCYCVKHSVLTVV